MDAEEGGGGETVGWVVGSGEWRWRGGGLFGS